MPMPEGLKVIDAMLRPNTQSEHVENALEYLFKDLDTRKRRGQTPEEIVAVMDEYNVEKALWNSNLDNPEGDGMKGLKKFPDRLIPYSGINPWLGMEAVRMIEEWHKEYDVRCIHIFPASVQLPHNDNKLYPIFAKCCELGIAVSMNVGVPGPQGRGPGSMGPGGSRHHASRMRTHGGDSGDRYPAYCQDPLNLDEVCWFFPELKVVMNHGGEPWQFLCVKLMIKWPNLFYKTSAFAPRHFPADIIYYANTRGSDKVMFATGHPLIDLARAMGELPDVPLRDHVWPKFAHDNAAKLFRM
ncbi:MAG: amidohydrolase family protein [Chloroflexi bacterium]|nr:amidohydrolase family protein [Chloroflexota bacterium]